MFFYFNFQKQKILFRKNWPNEPESVQGKASSLITIAAMLGQTFSSIVAGPLLASTQDVNTLMLTSVCAGVLVALVTLLTPMPVSGSGGH